MVLKLPETGLELESSARSMATLPLQAFAITLDDDILEDMIESFQSGKGIELSLGQSPVRLLDIFRVCFYCAPDRLLLAFSGGAVNCLTIGGLPYGAAIVAATIANLTSRTRYPHPLPTSCLGYLPKEHTLRFSGRKLLRRPNHRTANPD